MATENTSFWSRNKGMIIFLIVLLLLIGAGLVYYFFFYKKDSSNEETAPVNPNINENGDDVTQEYEPPAPPPGVTDVLTPLEHLMIYNLPWKSNPKILDGRVPIIY